MTRTRRSSAIHEARVLWRRRRWVAIIVFALSLATLLSLIAGMPDLYRASATVLVKQDVTSEVLARSPVTGEFEPRLEMLSEQILSRPRLEELIKRFDLYRAQRVRGAPEMVIERMRKDLKLERKQAGQAWGRSTTVAFTLSYQGWDPQVAAKVVNALVAYYVEENERLRERQLAGSQAAGSVDELTRLKRELADLRSRYSERYPDVVRLRAQVRALQRERDEAGRGHADAPPAAMAAADGGTQFRVLEPALAPSEPSAPARVRLAFMALVLSAGLAGVAVLLADQLDTSFHRLDDVWAFTDVPVLASIPRIETPGDAWRRALRFGLVTVLVGAGVALLAQAGLYAGRHGQQLVWMLAQRAG